MLDVITARVAWAFTEPNPCLIFSANNDNFMPKTIDRNHKLM
jgi:hypothetical protein